MKAEDLRQFFHSHPSFAVISHVSPDGDAVSSTLAMGMLLQRLGKEVTMVNADPIPKKFASLPQASQILTPDQAEARGPFSAVVTVDAADMERLGETTRLWAPDAEVANLDHHPTNTRFGQLNYVLPEAAASAQVIYTLAQELAWELNREIATCLYTGLLTDTGGFRYSNTTADVMRMAGHLLEFGLDPAALAGQFLEQITYSHLRLLARGIERLQQEEEGRLGWTYITLEDVAELQAREEDVDGLVSYVQRLEGTEVGILFREVPAGVKVSFRSKRWLNVAEVALSFGGGGHLRASGCTVEGRLQDVIPQVLDRVKTALRRGGA